jgi:flagellar hook assembly protein FlgD
MRVFNTLGQQVRTLVDMDQRAGQYAIMWDGRDDLGREVASGIYFCQLRIGGFHKTIKMMLLK